MTKTVFSFDVSDPAIMAAADQLLATIASRVGPQLHAIVPALNEREHQQAVLGVAFNSCALSLINAGPVKTSAIYFALATVIAHLLSTAPPEVRTPLAHHLVAMALAEASAIARRDGSDG